jgi:phosphomannomutase
VKLNWESDGNFPKGRPDPLIPENREEIARLVVESGADFGVAWDADADRCFFFTEKGEFIEGYFITALLGGIFLQRNTGATILHDPRLIWAIRDVALENGGKDIINKSGHAFIKERMRKDDVVFGGEMSAHYYFKDYFYCDNGLIPFVMMLEFLSTQEKTLSEIMTEMFWNKYFVSGEINSEVSDVKSKISEAKEKYAQEAESVDEIDGVSIEYADWRFNLRGSNTEPVIRLNVEAKSKELMAEKREELLSLIRG